MTVSKLYNFQFWMIPL